MTSTDFLSSLLPVVAAYSAVFVLAGVLPFVLAFHLDGVVQIVRGNGPTALIAAFVMSVVIAMAGYFALRYAAAQPQVTPVMVTSLTTMAPLFLVCSVPLASIAFIVRTVKFVRTGPRRRQRSPKPARP